MKKVFITFIVSGVCLLIAAIGCQSGTKAAEVPAASSNGGQPQSWTQAMIQLRETLLKIEPFLVDEKKFGAAENEEQLGKDIAQLSETSKNVVHNPTLISRDPTVRFVASQFTQDIQRSADSFAQGKKEFSRYQLMKVTGYCIECHTRTQQGPQYEGPEQNKNLQSLTRFQKAEYLISVRYFDEALKLLEEEITSAAGGVGFARAERAAKYGLMITVQYKQDPVRALEFVQKIEESKGAPYALKVKAKAWKKSLKEWNAEKVMKPGSPGLAFYRKLASRKDSEVDQMRALAGLLPWLSTDLKPDQLGEGLYLVGTCYESLSDLSLFSLHENYYESCVRSAAHTPWAKKCYEKLEDSIRFGYSGSGGTHIPVEVQVYLDNLKKGLD